MTKNNLFKFATSELSQDAFICWLLNFAHKEHLTEDSVLTECAKKLLQKMLPEERELLVTDIQKQHNNIDVLVEVNGKYSIIIEDKTFSNVHDDQINRYKKNLIDSGESNIKSVYFKIVEQPFEENVDINLTRKDLLDVFKEYVNETKNVIFRDYYDYLKEIDRDVNSYKNSSIAVWGDKEHKHTYKGFFTHLVQDNIIQTTEDDVINGRYNWKYVSNKQGGFWCLWWYSIKKDRLDACNLLEKYIYELYLEIEDNQIVIKMAGDSQETKAVRWSLYRYCKNIMPEFEKKVFRKGNHMTVGYIKYDQNNYCEKIKSMESLMRSIVGGQYKFETEM